MGGFAGLPLTSRFRAGPARARGRAPRGSACRSQAGIDDQGEMGAPVGESEQSGRVIEQFADRLVVAVDIAHHREEGKWATSRG